MLRSPDLAALGDVHPADYVHVAKLAEPAGDLSLPTAYLKWYDVRREDLAIDPEARETARRFLLEQAESGELALNRELGFVIFHRSGSGYFLIVCTWRGANEMHQTLYAGDGSGFALVPKDLPHVPTQCVWELGVTSHERRAWSTFLFSARDDDAKCAYVEDRFRGIV